MRIRIPLSLMFAALLAAPASWAQVEDIPDADPPPPPGMDEPPVREAVATELPPPLPDEDGAPAADLEPPAAADGLPPKIPPPPGTEPPEVTIRTDADTGDVVEEYRQGGRVYMVVVRPPVGPPYRMLDTNGDGRLDTQDAEGPVNPVYWKIYEWN